jgi:hypothetical protein
MQSGEYRLLEPRVEVLLPLSQGCSSCNELLLELRDARLVMVQGDLTTAKLSELHYRALLHHRAWLCLPGRGSLRLSSEMLTFCL